MQRYEWTVGERIVMLQNYWFANKGKTGTVVKLVVSAFDNTLTPFVQIDGAAEGPVPMADSVMRPDRTQ